MENWSSWKSEFWVDFNVICTNWVVGLWNMISVIRFPNFWQASNLLNLSLVDLCGASFLQPMGSCSYQSGLIVKALYFYIYGHLLFSNVCLWMPDRFSVLSGQIWWNVLRFRLSLDMISHMVVLHVTPRHSIAILELEYFLVTCQQLTRGGNLWRAFHWMQLMAAIVQCSWAEA